MFPGGNDSFLSKAYRLADAHIVLAGEFKRDLRRWGFDAPIYVETTVVPDYVMARCAADRKFDPQKIHLLFLSRLEKEKGVNELVDAFAILQRRRPDVYTLTLAGDGPFLRTLQQRVESLGVPDIRFTGFVAGEEKIACFLEASIFCFLSYTEGMPNAVLEAMAMGLPLISSDAGGLKDILKDGETGFITKMNRSAPSGSRFCLNEVVDRIEKLTDDPELYYRISAHNSSYARERFAAGKVAARLESIYRDLLGQGPKNADLQPTPQALNKRISE